ncbi:MAG: PAM68 family protein [Xenococcaceae cyanobacterium]
MSSKSPRERLPFEPRQKKKKTPKKNPVLGEKTPEKSKKSAYEPKNAQLSAIPDAVSKRMVRRMALFCGIPTALGLSSFFVFYWIVSQEWFKLPTAVVLFVSIGFFGLGVLGLSYGILSTSWDENRVGGWWGWEEFKVNFGRMTAAWRSAGKEARGE